MPLDTLGCTRATLIASKSSLGDGDGTSGWLGATLVDRPRSRALSPLLETAG